MQTDLVLGGVRLPLSLLEVAMTMRAESPALFKSFQQALREAGSLAANDTVSAPPDSVHLAQGRARAMMALSALFAEPEKFHAQQRQLRSK